MSGNVHTHSNHCVFYHWRCSCIQSAHVVLNPARECQEETAYAHLFPLLDQHANILSYKNFWEDSRYKDPRHSANYKVLHKWIMVAIRYLLPCLKPHFKNECEIETQLELLLNVLTKTVTMTLRTIQKKRRWVLLFFIRIIFIHMATLKTF